MTHVGGDATVATAPRDRRILRAHRWASRGDANGDCHPSTLARSTIQRPAKVTQDDAYSPSDISAALPPAAAVLIGHGLFGRKARQIMRPAGLGAGAGQAMAAERLHADHGADHVAVDVDVADREPVDHMPRSCRRCASECRASARSRSVRSIAARRSSRSRGIAHHMQDRVRTLPRSVDRRSTVRKYAARRSCRRERRRRNARAPRSSCARYAHPAAASPRHRSPVRHGWPGRAGSPICSSRAAPAIISIMRSATSSCTNKQPQRRAALAGRAERRGHDVVGDLLGQRGGIDDHRIDAAGLRDQRHDRAVLGGERAVDRARDLGRAGEDDAGDVGMRDQRRADAAVAGHADAAPRRARRPHAAGEPPRPRSAASVRPALRPPHCRPSAPP